MSAGHTLTPAAHRVNVNTTTASIHPTAALAALAPLAGAYLAAPDADPAVTLTRTAEDIVRVALSAPVMAGVDAFLAVMAGGFVALALAVVGVRAWDAYAPRALRAVGRHAFRVARAAYRMAR